MEEVAGMLERNEILALLQDQLVQAHDRMRQEAKKIEWKWSIKWDGIV